jgi:AcrR family transcriptional regulator
MPRLPDPHVKVKLLAAAERVFAAHGLAAAKVEAITRAAGVAKGSFYLHFGSKEEAFQHLVEAMLARMATYIEALPDEHRHSLADVQAFLDFWVNNDVQIFEFIWQNRGLMALLLEGGKCADYRYLVDRFADSARLRVRDFLANGMARELYRADLDLELTSAFIAGAYDRLARQVVEARTKPDLVTRLREVQRLVLRGIGSAPLLAAMEPPASPRRARKSAPP